MKLLLDECVVQEFRRFITGHDVFTLGYLRWQSTKNGRLLARAKSHGFDALVTTDRGIEHEQNPVTLPISVFVIDAPTNDLEDLLPFVPRLLDALSRPPAGPRVVRID